MPFRRCHEHSTDDALDIGNAQKHAVHLFFMFSLRVTVNALGLRYAGKGYRKRMKEARLLR